MFVVIAAAMVCGPFAAATAFGSERFDIAPGETNWIPREPQPNGFNVLYTSSAQALIECLLGPNIEVQNATLSGAPVATGLFSGGVPVIGFGTGIVLGTGDISSIVGPNLMDNVSTNNGLVGDPDLDGLVPGYETFDATILEFDFMCPGVDYIGFQYVFMSEEYNEWVWREYNDVIGFFVNGNTPAHNIAKVPNACGNIPGIPVSINNVNCDTTGVGVGINCGCYRNNDLDDGGGAIDTEMDGMTLAFVATGAIQPGWNHMKIAIADAGDHLWDSNVLIGCESLQCLTSPTDPSVWGDVKALFR